MKAKNLANQNRQGNHLAEWWQNEGWRKPARAGQIGGAQPGQALVEFALCLPFLLLLFVILVETGFLVRSHMTMAAAVGEGVRVAAARGNADPAFVYDKNNGNASNTLVGADGDLILVQNVNTALQDEHANVRMLMTYRADITENATSITNSVAVTVGVNGIGGAYGVYFNPAVSKYPFQEVFAWNNRTKPDGTVERWFSPTVLSQPDCASVYVGTKSYSAVYPTTTTSLGNTYSGPAFCGDATKQNYGTSTSGGINRTIKLGQYSAANTNIDNYTGIVSGNNEVPGTGTACSQTTKQKYDPASSNYPSTPLSMLRCWRANAAPWYPAVRWSIEGFTNPDNNASGANYQNSQREVPKFFGDTANYVRSPDYIGVRLDYHHPSFFQILKLDFLGVKIAPFDLDLSDRAVKIMEPTSGSAN